MRRARPEHAELWQEVPARTMDESTAEEVPLLLIDELEARLTPDGPFPPHPPGGQVGWGC
jgi:hypothetical protein